MTAGTVFLAFLLGVSYLAIGALKLMVPYEQGRAKIGWIGDVPSSRYRLAGLLEIAGGIGLMFPTMVDAFHWLTAFAAAGLALIMIGATYLHIRRGDWGYVMLTLVLLSGCGYVAGAAVT